MHARDVFIHLFDIVFPPSAELRTVRELTSKDVPSLFTEEMAGTVITLSDFNNPKVRALIHEAKFHGNGRACSLLGTVFLMHLEHQRATYDHIVPIPLSRTRRRTRGYNQVHEILRRAARSVSLPIADQLLTRVRNTQPQTELKRSDRLINLRGAFKVVDPTLVAGKHLLLVDDVVTTGATLEAAAAALREHSPASVTCLALAH